MVLMEYIKFLVYKNLFSLFNIKFESEQYTPVSLKYHPTKLRFLIILSWVRLDPLGTAATTGLLYQPQVIDDGDYEAIGGMKIGKGNRSTRRKPAPVPLFHH
jgi:hypothetical protein